MSEYFTIFKKTMQIKRNTALTVPLGSGRLPVLTHFPHLPGHSDGGLVSSMQVVSMTSKALMKPDFFQRCLENHK